jgi:aerobic carbon-monoxide dehydrogenase medium subunit
MTQGTEYRRATSIDHALAILGQHQADAMIVAGGIVVGSLVNQRLTLPPILLDISRIAELKTLVEAPGGGLLIGPLITHEEVLRSPIVKRHAPLLSEMACEISCNRLRNRGTLGGSLCTVGGQGDPATGLIALGGSLRLRGSRGTRTLPVEEFYKDSFSTDLSPDEILEQVLVPPIPQQAMYAFGKHGPRSAMDWTQITVAVVLQEGADGKVEAIRIGLNGVAPTPSRTRHVEAALLGQRADALTWDPVLAGLEKDVEPDGDLIFSSSYKLHLSGVLLRRTVQRALAKGNRAEAVRC